MPSPQVGKEKEQQVKAAAAAAEKKEGKEEGEAEKKQNRNSSKILKAARADLSHPDQQPRAWLQDTCVSGPSSLKYVAPSLESHRPFKTKMKPRHLNAQPQPNFTYKQRYLKERLFKYLLSVWSDLGQRTLILEEPDTSKMWKDMAQPSQGFSHSVCASPE